MTLFFFVLALVIFSFQWIFQKTKRKNTVELLLISLVVFALGCSGIGAFIAHIFYADRTAALIGWAPGSPFQFEVGIANLAMGVLALLSFWFRGPFLFAAVLANSIWLWGDAVGHIRNILLTGNMASGNAGIYLWTDLLIPLVILILYWQRERRLH